MFCGRSLSGEARCIGVSVYVCDCNFSNFFLKVALYVCFDVLVIFIIAKSVFVDCKKIILQLVSELPAVRPSFAAEMNFIFILCYGVVC